MVCIHFWPISSSILYTFLITYYPPCSTHFWASLSSILYTFLTTHVHHLILFFSNFVFRIIRFWHFKHIFILSIILLLALFVFHIRHHCEHFRTPYYTLLTTFVFHIIHIIDHIYPPYSTYSWASLSTILCTFLTTHVHHLVSFLSNFILEIFDIFYAYWHPSYSMTFNTRLPCYTYFWAFHPPY